MITTYLLGGLGDDPAALAQLRIGACLNLRHERRQVEVCTQEDGRPLGHLPFDDARAIAELIRSGTVVRARVTGVVPAFRRPRVQLRVEVE